MKLRLSFCRARQAIRECTLNDNNATFSKDFQYPQEDFSNEHATQVHTATHR